MRSFEDTRGRWQVTTKHLASLKDLQKSVKSDDEENPCLNGLRSVCWKTFLLFQTNKQAEWPQILADSRSAYTALRGHLLRFIENPDELGSALDPLDDDQHSPWNVLRQDSEIRAEIFQDVERCMPEEPYFRKPETQRILLDVLFVFCKINQDVGYRQGMHEVLAPLLWVIDQDSLDITSDDASKLDPALKSTLDRTYIEHDAFTLFSLIMRSAKSFYELGEPEGKAAPASAGSNTPSQGSPIVVRSKKIHEEYLARVDPELAKHLTDIEVLPQIFLIRWIRLIFGREFPFTDLLALWDTLFAEDPGLDLIDLVCVAMLLRIRWELLDSNYSYALMLLLKYPAPTSPNGPKSFVEDALFLRDNFNANGGATLIKKHSGRTPQFNNSSRPVTPAESTTSPRQRLLRTKSPLPSPARFLQQQGSMGELFQGAAKGLLDRGEKLGINQAVRDAVGEAKKNVSGISAWCISDYMQNLQASRSASFNRRVSSDSSRWSLDEGRTIQSAQVAMNSVNARNRQLARMLDQAMVDLRASSTSKSNDKNFYVKAMDLAIAKVEFVKVYLEDSTMPLPAELAEKTTEDGAAGEAQQTKDTASTSAPETSSPSQPKEHEPKSDKPGITTAASNEKSTAEDTNPDTSETAPKPATPKVVPIVEPLGVEGKIDEHSVAEPTRPSAPLPTRSSIAQSNFAWMLEPDESSNTTSRSPPLKSSTPFLKSARKPTSGASRDKAAFLFGEEGNDSDANRTKSPFSDADAGFNLGTLKGGKGKSSS